MACSNELGVRLRQGDQAIKFSPMIVESPAQVVVRG